MKDGNMLDLLLSKKPCFRKWKIMLGLCMILQAGVAIGQSSSDVNQVLSMILSHEEFTEILSEEQESQKSICIVTNGNFEAPDGRIDREWTTGSGQNVGSGPCMDVSDFSMNERKVMMRFSYGKYRVKAKMRRSTPGADWRKTSFTVKGKGKFVMDKEF
ncbi:MAG: hypothetical protein KTR24_13570 [Saprospiraceae bacterium]|nr:hypothetical protein [Saprospiraceae bacterium]